MHHSHLVKRVYMVRRFVDLEEKQIRCSSTSKVAKHVFAPKQSVEWLLIIYRLLFCTFVRTFLNL